MTTPGRTKTAVIDAVDDACTVATTGASAAVFWLTGATALTALTLVPELSYDGVTWLAGTMHTTNQTAATPITVSAALAANSAYAWHVPAQGARFVRLRATAISAGSANLHGFDTEDTSTPR